MTANAANMEWRRARDCIGAAHVCHSGGFYADAISRAYYAVMHAAKAALAVHGVSPVSHPAVANRFGLVIVQAGLAESHWVSEITHLSLLRMDADYKVSRPFSEAESINACVRADAFLVRIRKLLPPLVSYSGEDV